MTDSLRDRIAAIAQNHVRCDDCTFAKTPRQRYLHFADEVIAELGLKREEALHSLLPEYERNVVRANVWASRYVTDWKNEE